jgi:Tol biopolymer transport system component
MSPDVTDQLSQTAAGAVRWTEEAGDKSRIVSSGPNERSKESAIEDAEFPVASSGGKFLAYLRSTKGTSRLWLHSLRDHQAPDILLTPAELDVREMTFLPDGSLIFAAAPGGGEPRLYAVNLRGKITTVGSGVTRYPAASPDGRWLAYSQLERGVWNLWLRNLDSGDTRRLTSAECNDLSPTWELDSRTLIYASDCGRALWLTALYRRRVIP